MTIDQYITRINERYKTGISREHSYRGDLQTLLEELLTNVLVTNEPARIKCGAPDYILTKKNIPVGYIEAKDMGDADLAGKNKNKEQFNRYKDSLPNLIFTDYLNFRLYREGEFITAIRIADIEDGEIIPKPEKFSEFRDLITDFATQTSQTIRSASKLSKMMAGKARMLSTIIENALIKDEEDGDRVNESANTTLREQLAAFQNVLIHDIDAKEFADIYAQTIAYGMFAARLHDPTLDTFSRHEAAELIPKTNPFLRKLFQYIAGYDLDRRITWVVDALADIFRATDVAALLQDFGKATQQNDPIIHFYETFLAEFDPALRKSRGVWYTPEPVVNFIVRAVDDILKDEFGLKDGLADTSKTTVKVNTDVKDKRSVTGYKQEEQEVHKVQILDPAAGTGTFLAEAIKQIYAKFEGQQGLWPSYVENHLIPRLNGFELLMASYAMAHLKLDMLLRETGYDRETDQRFRVYLTNSLEEHHPDTGTLFAGWLSNEANEANHVKRDTPVMVVMGNPPYSGESSNKGDWIMDLMKDYKKEPGGKKKLQERNSKWINDDYVKFLRYGQHFVEKNGEGVLAFINPHGFLDNPTFRGMRWNLLKTYDKIYTIDLHGNANKKEKAPDGGKDENVFDILQGVSINIFIKKASESKDLAQVFHHDFYGIREKKYEFLRQNNLDDIRFEILENHAPKYYMVKMDYELEDKYKNGFSCDKLFKNKSNGIVTARDHFTIQDTKKLSKKITKDFVQLEDEVARKKYQLGKDVRDWKIHLAKEDLKSSNLSNENYVQITYRPFDAKWTYYTGKSKGFHCMPRGKVMDNYFLKDNLGLLTTKGIRDEDFNHVFLTEDISEAIFLSSTTATNAMNFPLYLYPEDDGQQTLDGRPARRPNLNMDIVEKIADGLGLKFVPESSRHSERSESLSNEVEESPDNEHPPSTGGSLDSARDDSHGESLESTFGMASNSITEASPDEGSSSKEQDGNHSKSGLHLDSFAPIDLLDYIYAVLHSPTYRDKYKEFLKIDFPRVPYPSDAETFWQLVELGGELRQIHLLEHPVVDDFITTYPEAGSNEITHRLTKTQPGFVPDNPTRHSERNEVESKNLPDKGTANEEETLRQAQGDKHVLGKVWINEKQYFGNVPEKAWNFYIGGYQPAEKWLKDRRDRELSVDEIQHYQKIIVALMETDRIMQQIDGIEIA